MALTPWVGRFSDRYGNKPTILLCQALVAFGPLFYLLATPAIPSGSPGAFVVWSAFVGLNVCLPNLTFRLAPAGQIAPYTAIYFGLSGLAYGASTLTSGWLLDSLAASQSKLDRGRIDVFACFFAASWVARMLGLARLSGLREPGAWTCAQIRAAVPPGRCALLISIIDRRRHCSRTARPRRCAAHESPRYLAFVPATLHSALRSLGDVGCAGAGDRGHGFLGRGNACLVGMDRQAQIERRRFACRELDDSATRLFERPRIGIVGRRLQAGHITINQCPGILPQREARHLPFVIADADSERLGGIFQHHVRPMIAAGHQIGEIHLFGIAGLRGQDTDPTWPLLRPPRDRAAPIWATGATTREPASNSGGPKLMW